jgi:chromosome segregation ATPase
MLNFLKNFSLVQGEKAGEGLVNLATFIDANGVSETAIKQKQDEHSEMVKQLVGAQADFKREKAEFDAVNLEYNKKMAGAERAQAALEANPDDNEAAEALNELLNAVEKLAPKLDKEKAEYEAAQHWMNELQQASDEVAKELLGLREQINEVKTANKQAELDLDRAKKQQAQAEQLAGLRKSSNKFGTAMTALQNQATAKQAEAAAARITAQQLTVKPVTVSSAASKYLDDAPVVSTESLQDRLARLKTKL